MWTILAAGIWSVDQSRGQGCGLFQTSTTVGHWCSCCGQLRWSGRTNICRTSWSFSSTRAVAAVIIEIVASPSSRRRSIRTVVLQISGDIDCWLWLLIKSVFPFLLFRSHCQIYKRGIILLCLILLYCERTQFVCDYSSQLNRLYFCINIVSRNLSFPYSYRRHWVEPYYP